MTNIKKIKTTILDDNGPKHFPTFNILGGVQAPWVNNFPF